MKPLLIVSASGRALAESARRGGWAPVVMDAFADRDTRKAAARCLPVPARAGGIDQAKVIAALEAFPRGGDIVYGGGLESEPHVIDALHAHGRVHGNDGATVRAVCDPDYFFPVLRAHGIPHPVTRRCPPRSTGWLRKRAGDCGGAHVRPWDRNADDDDPAVYFQRFVEGPAMSALFLADGISARVIGFNNQWTACDDHRAPFRYAGAVSKAPLSLMYAAMLEEWAGILTREFGLRGLNGIDFIASEDGPLVIELNPRPCSTLELYDRDLTKGLLALHIQTCLDGLPREIPWQTRRVRAHAVVYARRPLRVPASLRWPDWSSDLPRGKQLIAVGEPICSVHGDGENARVACRLVRQRQARIESRFWDVRASA